MAAFIIAAGLLILMVLNVSVLLPGIAEVYGIRHAGVIQDPIDRATVNEAIKTLNTE